MIIFRFVLQVLLTLLASVGSSLISYAVGLPVAIPVVLVTAIFALLWFAIDQEKDAACAAAVQRTLDHVANQGIEFDLFGKTWKKGCRFDPETGEVIYPSCA
jgi:hypothetical protein